MKKTNRNVIEDELFYPYYIKINDTKNYTIFEIGGREPISFHTSIIATLEKLALFHTDLVSKKDTRTLREYIEEYYQKLDEFRNVIKF